MPSFHICMESGVITLHHAEYVDELCHPVQEPFPEVVCPLCLLWSGGEDVLEVSDDAGGALECLRVEVAVELQFAGGVPLALALGQKRVDQVEEDLALPNQVVRQRGHSEDLNTAANETHV